jgi:hydrogenase expression/formation protein HypE
MGKLKNEQLRNLLGCIKENPQVVVPPMVGYDSGVHYLGDNCVVVSADPCVGVPEEWFGWLLINYAASDVALFGAKPQFCSVSLLGPLSAEPKKFQGVMRQACCAADELSMSIVTGHTGTYGGLLELVGVCTAYGTVNPDRLLTPGKAKPKDLILCVKTLGLETLTNFSLIHKSLAEELFGTKDSTKLAGRVREQSCVKEAGLLAEVEGVHAMHDVTEGGLVAALNELAVASKLGFRIAYEHLPFAKEMPLLKEKFGLSDNQLISVSSAGVVLAAVDPQAKDEVRKVLDNSGAEYSFLGEFTENERRFFSKSGKEKPFPKLSDDPYGMILSGKV